ncbi:DUF2130 domain-containing protein [Spiroplasma sp. DGKH1]|uniref:DUF2130 domain-containing protein n=1 Tax=Spiroplasma sp. DGKH1 TaxID=3050074 RepID=UPI0034C6DB4E
MDYKITCPHCGKTIDLQKLDLAKDEHIKAFINQEVKEKLEASQLKLKAEYNDLLIIKASEQEENLRLKITNEFNEKEKELQKQLSALSELNIHFQETQKTHQADLANERKNYTELVQTFNNLKDALTDSIQKNFDYRYEQATKEYHEKIDQLNEQIRILTNVKNKGNQSEKDFADFLTNQFEQYGDVIERVNPGKNGADIIHQVKISNHKFEEIYYEIKDVDTFQTNYITKFIQDINNRNLQFGAIIARNIPAEWRNNGEYIKEIDNNPGLFVCTFEAARVLFILLRKLVLETEKIKITNQQEYDLKTEIYQKINSPEFRALFKKINELLTDANKKLTALNNTFIKTYGELLSINSDIESNILNLIASLKLN